MESSAKMMMLMVVEVVVEMNAEVGRSRRRRWSSKFVLKPMPMLLVQ